MEEENEKGNGVKRNTKFDSITLAVRIQAKYKTQQSEGFIYENFSLVQLQVSVDKRTEWSEDGSDD